MWGNATINGFDILKISFISSYSTEIILISNRIIQWRRERKITKRKRKLTDIQGVGTEDVLMIMEFGYHIGITISVELSARGFSSKWFCDYQRGPESCKWIKDSIADLSILVDKILSKAFRKSIVVWLELCGNCGFCISKSDEGFHGREE